MLRILESHILSIYFLLKKNNEKTGFNLARVGLEDCEEATDDNDARVPLDPLVWAHPIKSNQSMENEFENQVRMAAAETYLRQNMPNPFHAHHQQPSTSQHQQQMSMNEQFMQMELQYRQQYQQQQQRQHQQQQQMQQQQNQQQMQMVNYQSHVFFSPNK